MASEGLGEMFKGEFADMHIANFLWCQWGADQRVARAKTREQALPSAPSEFLEKIKYLTVERLKLFNIHRIEKCRTCP